MGAKDTLRRVAGDQFALVKHTATESEVISHAQRILEMGRSPYKVDDFGILITTSIGIVWAPENGADPTRLLQNVDIATQHSKLNGRNQFTYFQSRMRYDLERNVSISQALQEALESSHGLSLAFQPQICISTNRICGAEVLIRWEHPSFGVVSPSEFVPIGENSGLARILDIVVLDLAIKQLMQWINNDVAVRLSINISVLSLQLEGMADRIISKLCQSGIPSNLIEIEVTETHHLENSEEVLSNIKKIREFGVTVALDDFGTGHASLSYLQNLPIDIIKIDRSFIQKIDQSGSGSNAIVSAILAMAKELNLKVVAEGVETKEQYDWLASRGCQMIQGFFVGKPMKDSDFIAFYRKQTQTGGPSQTL